MSGTIFAVFLIGLALVPALKAAERYVNEREASGKQKRLLDRYVTHEELEEILSKEAKKVQWANEEWHEKFSTLHARLSKRVKKIEPPENEELGFDLDEEQPSVLAYRRLGSV